jgi:hypothetical protein
VQANDRPGDEAPTPARPRPQAHSPPLGPHPPPSGPARYRPRPASRLYPRIQTGNMPRRRRHVKVEETQRPGNIPFVTVEKRRQTLRRQIRGHSRARTQKTIHHAPNSIRLRTPRARLTHRLAHPHLTPLVRRNRPGPAAIARGHDEIPRIRSPRTACPIDSAAGASPGHPPEPDSKGP